MEVSSQASKNKKKKTVKEGLQETGKLRALVLYFKTPRYNGVNGKNGCHRK